MLKSINYFLNSKIISAQNYLKKNYLKKRKGQALSEYGILLALVVIAVIAILVLLGPKIANSFKKVSDSLPN